MKKIKLTKRKIVTLLVALILIIGVEIGVMLAFIIDATGPVENEFVPGKVQCEIVEQVSGNVKTSVKVKNPDVTDEADIFVRVAVVANNVDEAGNIVSGTPDISASLSSTNLGTDWVKIEDYYYYKPSLKPGEMTGELLDGSISLTGIQVTILAEAIQAEPADAAEEAWGVTVGTDSSGNPVIVP